MTSTPTRPAAQPSTMEVPLLDLTTQFQALREELLAAVTDVLDSQQCINGPAVRQFEKQLNDYCGTAGAVGVSSGTDALLCALMAMEIGQGDEVITTPFTFFATAGSIWRVGAKPVFVDIDPETFNIDPAKIAAAVTDKTRAIMPVHLFGQCAEMDPINAIAKQHDLFVIEDAAQAISATYKGKPAGQLGDVACFSFFPSKNLGGAGDGGACVSMDKTLVEKMQVIRMHGSKPKYYHHVVGGNFRLDSVQAAYLGVKLAHLDSWSQARRKNAALYDELLADLDEVATPIIREHNTSIYNQYVIRAQRRDELMKHLQAANVGSAIYYPLSLHEQACFADLGHQTGDFPESEKAAQEVLAIPVYPEMSEPQVRYVAQTIKAFYA